MSWTLIEHQALTSSVASVTLGSGGTIPQTYKTLRLFVSARSDASSIVSNIRWTFNGSSSGYSWRELYGDGSAAASGNGSTSYAQIGYGTAATATANTFGSTEAILPNYTSTTANKPLSVDGVQETNATGAYQDLGAGLWSNTAAITSITITPGTGNWASGSTFTLYGLA